jgi:hypothetical protein
VTWSGRFGGKDKTVVGRVVAEGPNIASFASNVSTAIGTPVRVASTEETPFLVDLQAEGRGDILTIVSKQLDINETRGRLDLTIASNPAGLNLTGALALSIVDAGKWQSVTFDDAGEAENTNQAPLTISPLPITGALDVTVEGVRVAGDMVQNIDFTVEANEGSVGLSKFQALFPGGTAVAARASTNTGGPIDGNGAVSIVSGRLPTFLNWAGIDVKDKVPAGRLATAKLASRLQFNANGWQLSGLTGNIDTANYSGAMAGIYAAPFLSDIDLAVDQVNLDAYLPENSDANTETGADFYFPDNAVSVKLKGENLLFRGRQYSDVSVEVSWSAEGLKIQNGSTRLGNGSVSFTGGVSPLNDDLSYELNAGLADFPVSVLTTEMPALDKYINLLAISRTTGSVSLLGPMDDLRVSASMDHGEGKNWNLTGSLSLTEFKPNKFELQGGFKHPNTAPLLEDYGVGASSVPVDLTITANKASASTPIELRSTGDAGGGRLILDLASANDTLSGDISYDHPNAGSFSDQLGLSTPLPSPTEPLRLKAKASYADSEWSVTDIDISNGQATINGTVTANENKTVNGDLHFANWSTSLPARKSAVPTASN